ncbi:uncharacterized protein [Haliotis cracherodii]|uniref:uncharacterized protein n=1 Tax=Haliotis cracherodii TaxID=6455 RepID=UPI0039EC2538
MGIFCLKRCRLLMCFFFVFLTGLLLTGCSVYFTNTLSVTGYRQTHPDLRVLMPVLIPASKVSMKCPNVLEQASIGRWVKHSFNATQLQELERFYHTVLKDRAPLPSTLQRSDGKCGNTTYDSSPATAHWRAVCSPIGKTPCCYNNQCVARSVEGCRCEHCFDLRSEIHAEMAEWVPSDVRCRLKQHTPAELCDLLEGSSLYFVGDSLIRHTYIAFLMAIRGNYKDGAVMPGLSPEWYRNCTYLNMYGAVACRRVLDTPNPYVCGGRVYIGRFAHFKPDKTGELLDLVRNITNVKRTLIISGMALHVDMNYTAVQEYLKPAFDFLNTSGAQWPKFLFTGQSDFGALKNRRAMLWSKRDIFNTKMSYFAKSHGVLYLDLYNLTRGVRSFDGNHFGVGLNRAKVFIISNYIRDLKDKGEW